MLLKIPIIIFLAICYSFSSFSQELSEEERKLYALINEYRVEQKLAPIPFSVSLTQVAQMHCKDLHENMGYLTHAWSTCKYEADDSKTYSCMWLKPMELTKYKGYGYECAHSGYSKAESILNSWKGSQSHNNVIINKEIWADIQWKAIGVGIYKGYACIWFGEKLDE